LSETEKKDASAALLESTPLATSLETEVIQDGILSHSPRSLNQVPVLSDLAFFSTDTYKIGFTSTDYTVASLLSQIGVRYQIANCEKKSAKLIFYGNFVKANRRLKQLDDNCSRFNRALVLAHSNLLKQADDEFKCVLNSWRD
jgi:hypothetical protein